MPSGLTPTHAHTLAIARARTHTHKHFCTRTHSHLVHAMSGQTWVSQVATVSSRPLVAPKSAPMVLHPTKMRHPQQAEADSVVLQVLPSMQSIVRVQRDTGGREERQNASKGSQKEKMQGRGESKRYLCVYVHTHKTFHASQISGLTVPCQHPLQDKTAGTPTQRMLILDDDALRAIAADDMESSEGRGEEGAAPGSLSIHGQTRTEDGTSDPQRGGLGVRGGPEGPHGVNWLREQLFE